ncbi:MAG TPA: DUF362 domain-containing protein [Candidatus Ozemobacteraceae bacterium]|nr:DUF362 domain-containing protein [Candidatus Ozemobacteraceae bacterium]
MAEKPKVFTVGLRAKGPSDSHLAKIEKLARHIGMGEFAWKNKIVAVKTHFGERGNSSFPRPHYVRPLVDLIKAGGGKPFLAETTTLYTGSRSNAPDHIETALRHGFGAEVTGAPVIICDGLTGRDAHKVPINGRLLKEVSVAAGIVEADALVVLSHFKGHEVSGFGGAIKNLGMGCCSRSAKLIQHTSIRPSVLTDRCVRCRTCLSWCSVGAIRQEQPNGPVTIDPNVCQGCGECLVSCRVGAIRINWSEDAGKVTERMVEHALGVMENKKGRAFFVNLLTDIVPLCDCYGFSDAPIVPDIGFAASTDPVALDACCVDLVNAQIGLQNSALKGGYQPSEPKFAHVHEELDISIQLNYGTELGLGNAEYERVTLD